jgi:hypothetical protein
MRPCPPFFLSQIEVVAGQAFGTLNATSVARNPERRFTAPFRDPALDAAILLVIQASNAANTQCCANRK